MASNFDKNDNSDDNDDVVDKPTPPIRLNKTTNITKIKGWRKKKFNLDTADKEMNRNDSCKNVTQMGAERVDESLLHATDKTEPNIYVQDDGLTDGGSILKVNRNSQLLDSLVKKIGDTNESCGSRNILYQDQKNFQLDSINEIASRSDTDCSQKYNKMNNVSANSSVDSENLTDADKCHSFERSAFVSESLDDFLLNEPAVFKLNDTSQSPLSESLVLTRNEPGRFFKLVQAELKRGQTSVMNNLRRYGSKPKTLAEKRRILENSTYLKKQIELDKSYGEQSLEDSGYLKRAVRFKRRCKIKDVKRVLRSNIELLCEYSTTEIEYGATDKVLDNDDSTTKAKNNYNNIDRVLDSVVNNTDSVSLERGYRTSSSKEHSVQKKLWQVRHPQLSPYHINKHLRLNSPRSKVSQKLLKEKLRNINKNCLSENALKNIVYVKPLKKRIPYDFMSVLNEKEIVKCGSDLHLKRKVGMLLFLGIGRCLYQEQLENLECLRKDTCTIDENFVNFATSTVLDRKNPYKINRILMPVVSTKLLTFMNHYNLIRDRYQDFLINRFKIKIPSGLPASSLSNKNVAVSRVIDIETAGKSDSNTSLHSDSTSQLKPLKEIIEPNLKSAKNSVDQISITTSNDELSKSLCSSVVNKDSGCDSILSETNISTDDKTSCLVSADDNEADGSKKSPNIDIKFKKIVIKNGRIFHEDKKMTKLTYELRRLNHAFVVVDDVDGVDGERLNAPDAPEIVLPDDVLPNKLARVESDFHQTIMKSNEEFVFVSSFSERSQRQRKLPKKLEDTVLLNELSLTNKEHGCKKKLNRLVTSDKTDIVKARPQITVSEDVSSQDAQLPESIECLDSLCKKSKPSENPNETAPLKQPEKDSLEDNIKDIRDTETVIVQTSKSILKKNIACNSTDNAKTSSDGGSSRRLVDKRVESDIMNNKLVVIDGKYPVLRLHKFKPLHSTRIACMDHKLYNCLCIRNKLFPNLNVVHSNDGEAEIVISIDDQNSEDSMVVPRIEKVMTLRLEDFFKDDNSSSSPIVSKVNSSSCGEALRTLSKDDCGNGVFIHPSSLIVNNDNFSGNEELLRTSSKVVSSNVVSLGNNSSSLISKDNSFSNDKLLQTSTVHHSRLMNNCNTSMYGHIKRPRIAAPVRISDKCEYRFFCVRFTYSFSYIKFFGGLDLNEIPELKDQMLNNPSVDTNIGVILAYTGMLNMLRESFSKKQCVFQRLIKADYNRAKFNNLPFGIYAVCRNIILFGPYEMNEPHKLQAFRVVYKEAESGNASEVKQIPFVKPEFIKQFQDIEFAVGYWWYVANNQLSKDRDILEMINTKRILSPLKVSAPVRIPVKVPLLNGAVSQSIANQGHISGTLIPLAQNSKNTTKTSHFKKVENILHRSSEMDKSKGTPNVTNNNITEKSERNNNLSETLFSTVRSCLSDTFDTDGV